MLRATDWRSGFAPLLRVRTNLPRPFYTAAKSESGASPPCIHAPLPGQPCPHATSLRHTSTVHFHPVKTYFLLPVFYPTAQSPPKRLTTAGSEVLPHTPTRGLSLPLHTLSCPAARSTHGKPRAALPRYNHILLPPFQASQHKNSYNRPMPIFFKAHGCPVFFRAV